MNMKAVIVRQPGGVEQLSIGEYPKPQPHSDELLVRVHATALNRADIMQREGRYPPPQGASPLLGLEMAGVVEAVGPNCSGWKVGDRVCALLPGGGYAEYVTVPAKMAIPMPTTLSFSEAAAIPEVFLTAYQALFWIGKLRGGEKVLIHAGASGVGTAGIQMANMVGATPMITAGSAAKLDYCLKLGAKVAINYKDGEFAGHILNETHQKGVDLIIDPIGAAYWEQNITCMAIDGRLVLLATMGGASVDEVSLRKILIKRLRIQGSTLRAREQAYKVALTQEFVARVLPALEEGRIKPVIDTVMSWEDVAEAHYRMENNENIGKIVLRLIEEGDEPLNEMPAMPSPAEFSFDMGEEAAEDEDQFAVLSQSSLPGDGEEADISGEDDEDDFEEPDPEELEG